MREKLSFRVISFSVAVALMLTALLTGCSFGLDSVYVDVKPHDETYQITDDSSTANVTNQLSLKSAILNFILDGVETAIIRTEAFSDDMPSSISRVVREVTEVDPIGAFAVYNLTYEYSVILNYYEITLHISYLHDKKEIERIVYLNASSSARSVIARSINSFSSNLYLYVGDNSLDIDKEISDAYQSTQGTMCIFPRYTVRCFPEYGSQKKIYEVKFDYGASNDECRQIDNKVKSIISDIVEKNTSIDDKEAVARRIFYAMCRNTDVIPFVSDLDPYANSMYGVLVKKKGTSLGFAKTYQQLLIESGIMCSVVSGFYENNPYYWCRIELDGTVYYVDPARAVALKDMRIFLISPIELIRDGYSFVS